MFFGGRMMHKRLNKCGFLLLLCLILSLSVIATDIYRLGPGDQLVITVWERPDLKTEVVVGPDGRIAVPFAGQLNVNGLTLEEVETTLVGKLQAYILDPLVTVQVAKYRTFRVQVLGNVARPGFYNLESSSTLLDALALAGGPLQTADLEHIQVGNDQVNVAEILKNPNLDIKLTAGTTISVPAAKPVLVLGAVKNPGTYSLPLATKEQSILDVIALAGGLTLNADENKIRLDRDGKQTIFEGSLKELGDKTVQLGDTIVVSEKRQVVISGKVLRPGSYQISTGMGVSDAIALAGGLLQEAAHEVTIYKDNESVVLSVTDRTPLEGGESLIVGTSTEMVLVLGEVVKPGNYTLFQAKTLLEALAIAGGPTKSADLRQTVVGDKVVDLTKILANPKDDQKITSGTIVFVPQVKPILVLGDVNRPGSYDYEDGLSLLNLIGLAGGLRESANLSEVMIGESSYDVRAIMANRADDVLLKPGVTVYVPTKSPVLVLGAVRSPGTYIPSGEQTLLEVIAQAGGLLENADGAAISLQRSETEIAGSLATLGSERLQNGDIVTVNEREQVIIAGQVVRPGAYEVRNGLTVSGALALAGGLQNDAAKTLTIIKDDTSREVSVDSMETLIGGESLFVGASNQRILVLGDVARPGSFAWQEGFTVWDALASAGGQTETSDLENAYITRSGEMTQIDWSHNQLLYGGDIIEVPQWNRKVLVMGEVTRPGTYDVNKDQRLMDIIGLAGGLTGRADYEVTLRRNNQFESLNIAQAIINPADSSNVSLKGGEVIYVGESKSDILIFGEVQRPGQYGFKAGDTLAELITLAGGLTANADLNSIEVRVDDESYFVQIGDHELTGRETIFVHEVRPITVLGEVSNPGTVSVSVSARLVDVVAKAGGPTAFSDLGKIRIYRGGDPEEATIVSAGKGKLVFEGQASENPEVFPGDVVYVHRSNKLNTTEIAAYLSIINSLSNLLRAWL